LTLSARKEPAGGKKRKSRCRAEARRYTQT
jgi:hypothetical protein